MGKVSQFFVKAQPQIVGRWSTNAFWEKFAQAKKAVKDACWRVIGKEVPEAQTEGAGFTAQLSQAILKPARFQRLLLSYKPTFQSYARLHQQMCLRSGTWSRGAGPFGRDFLWRRLRAGHLVGFATLFLVHEERIAEEEGFKKRLEVYGNLCENLKTLFACENSNTDVENTSVSSHLGTKISDYKMGECIAVGSNGAVYEAEVLHHKIENGSNHQAAENSHFGTRSFKAASKNVNSQRSQKLASKNKKRRKVAVKMIFNFNSSNAGIIYRQTKAELVCCGRGAISGPAKDWQNGSRSKMKTLSPHCNVMRVNRAIVDRVPDHPEFAMMHPALLPHPAGCGRSSAMFLVMKRYEYTLRELLKKNLPLATRYLLALQLLNGVSHLERNNIAHRDLKSNNILIEHDSTSLPRLVISDFGCAFVPEPGENLTFPFLSQIYDIRNGNPEIQPPEITNCQPGPDAVLDYSKSDAWAAGIMLCEIMGIEKNKLCVEMRDGKSELRLLKRLICMLLEENPEKRISCTEASSILYLDLFGPMFAKDPSRNTPAEVTVKNWLLLHASETMAYKSTTWGKNSVVCELFTNFFSTISDSALCSAISSWQSLSV